MAPSSRRRGLLNERRHWLTEDGLVAAPTGDPLVHLDDLARLGVPGKVLDGALIRGARVAQAQLTVIDVALEDRGQARDQLLLGAQRHGRAAVVTGDQAAAARRLPVSTASWIVPTM